MEFFFLSVRQVLLFFLNMEVTSSSFPCWKRKKGSFGIFSKFHYIKTDYMKRSFEILINVSVSFFFLIKRPLRVPSLEFFENCIIGKLEGRWKII